MTGDRQPRLTARWARALGAGLLLALAASSARAAEPTAPARALAETLFREGRRLMKEKRYDEACRKLEESYRIDPAGGTLLNLALCHEEEGKTATAWSELKEALYAARQANRADRQQIARQHGEALEAKLSRITLSFAKGAETIGITVSLDGVALGAGAWNTPLPVDPGDHVIVASAPGRERWEQLVHVPAGPGEQAITVPLLTPMDAPRKEAPPPEEAPDVKRPIGWIVGGVGVAAVGVGAYFGLRAISLGADSDARCTSGVCDAEGYRMYDDGRSAATVSDVAFGVGLACLATGAVLLITSRSTRPDAAARLGVEPSLGRGSASLSVRGAF